MGDHSSLAPICFQRVNNINGKKSHSKDDYENFSKYFYDFAVLFSQFV